MSKLTEQLKIAWSLYNSVCMLRDDWQRQDVGFTGALEAATPAERERMTQERNQLFEARGAMLCELIEALPKIGVMRPLYGTVLPKGKMAIIPVGNAMIPDGTQIGISYLKKDGTPLLLHGKNGQWYNLDWKGIVKLGMDEGLGETKLFGPTGRVL